jgi:hypothetical protein
MRRFLWLIRSWLRPPPAPPPARRPLCTIRFAQVDGQKAMVFHHVSGKCAAVMLTWSGDLRKRSVN